jgi:hypothetical protein
MQKTVRDIFVLSYVFIAVNSCFGQLAIVPWPGPYYESKSLKVMHEDVPAYQVDVRIWHTGDSMLCGLAVVSPRSRGDGTNDEIQRFANTYALKRSDPHEPRSLLHVDVDQNRLLFLLDGDVGSYPILQKDCFQALFLRSTKGGVKVRAVLGDVPHAILQALYRTNGSSLRSDELAIALKSVYKEPWPKPFEAWRVGRLPDNVPVCRRPVSDRKKPNARAEEGADFSKRAYKPFSFSDTVDKSEKLVGVVMAQVQPDQSEDRQQRGWGVIARMPSRLTQSKAWIGRHVNGQLLFSLRIDKHTWAAGVLSPALGRVTVMGVGPDDRSFTLLEVPRVGCWTFLYRQRGGERELVKTISHEWKERRCRLWVLTLGAVDELPIAELPENISHQFFESVSNLRAVSR